MENNQVNQLLNGNVNQEQIEEWKKFKKNDSYLISNKGQVKNASTGKLMTKQLKNDYHYVNLSTNGTSKNYRVHILVAETFIGPKPNEKSQVNHKDSNKLNNCVDNLEWNTPIENMQHAGKNKLNHSTAKKIGQYNTDGTLVKEFASIAEATKETKIDNGSITKVCKGGYKNKTAGGYIWKYINEGDDDEMSEDEIQEIEENIEMKKIPNYEEYSATKEGKIFSHKRNKYVAEVESPEGYSRVSLSDGKKRKTFTLHKLIAEIFIENPDKKPEVMHKNKNNKDNRVDNLAWATHAEIVANKI